MPTRTAQYLWSLPHPRKPGKRYITRYRMSDATAAERHPDRIRIDNSVEYWNVYGPDENPAGPGLMSAEMAVRRSEDGSD